MSTCKNCGTEVPAGAAAPLRSSFDAYGNLYSQQVGKASAILQTSTGTSVPLGISNDG